LEGLLDVKGQPIIHAAREPEPGLVGLVGPRHVQRWTEAERVEEERDVVGTLAAEDRQEAVA
jgi:hypothetical protein